MSSIRMNDAEVRAKLRRYKNRMSSKRTRVKVLTEAAEEIESRYKDNVSVESGRLKRSITTKVRGDTVEVGSYGVEYAAAEEFGTSDQDPQPSLRPAIKHPEVERKVVDEYKRQSRRSIR